MLLRLVLGAMQDGKEKAHSKAQKGGLKGLFKKPPAAEKPTPKIPEPQMRSSVAPAKSEINSTVPVPKNKDILVKTCLVNVEDFIGFISLYCFRLEAMSATIRLKSVV